MGETVPPPPPEVIEKAVAEALAEDRADEDATTLSIPNAGEIFPARIFARERLVVCGLPLVEAALRSRGDVDFDAHARDGEEVASDATLAQFAAAAATILTAERVALNFLGRLSGIATATRAFVAAVPPGAKLKILDTRKTTPGLRDLEKYAVRAGGGENHRRDLAAQVFIKDNHIAVAGGIEPAVRGVRAAHGDVPIILEVQTVEEVPTAVTLGVSRILLDNFTDDEVREAVSLIGGTAEIEVSGRVSLERIPRLAEWGVDFVSIGALTHSARARDVSLDFLGGA